MNDLSFLFRPGLKILNFYALKTKKNNETQQLQLNCSHLEFETKVQK